jgi:8-oxo-dGTP diphosphatase
MAGPTFPLLLVAACALVDDSGRVLLTRRPEGKPLAGLWEFPGGKVEAHEIPETALVRELAEELGITVAHSRLTPLTFASHTYSAFHLLMPVFGCRQWQGDVTAREGQAVAWAEPGTFVNYEMPPADEPLKDILPRLLSGWRRMHEDDQRGSWSWTG